MLLPVRQIFFLENNMDNIKAQLSAFFQHGFIVINFDEFSQIHEIQNIVRSIFPCEPIELHRVNLSLDERLLLIKKAQDAIGKRKLVRDLLLNNSALFSELLGPDVDIQTNPYLRVSRPNLETDLVDWHRDTFNGNEYCELNIWFPVFPLEQGSGLTLLEGSHLISSKNIAYVDEENEFRKTVTKGSVANQLGFLYARKTDDSIRALDKNKVRMLAPHVGQAVFFFGHMVHRAQNHSSKTRLSIDVRIKNSFAQTKTKPGYYESFLKGRISRYVESMEPLNL